jgi:hypothetical protein
VANKKNVEKYCGLQNVGLWMQIRFSMEVKSVLVRFFPLPEGREAEDGNIIRWEWGMVCGHVTL